MQVPEFAEDDGPHLVLLEVERQAESVVRELEQLPGHRVLQAVDLGDAVADGDDAADVDGDEARVEILEPLSYYLRDLFGADSHLYSPRPYVAARRRRSCCNLVATLASTTRSPY